MKRTPVLRSWLIEERMHCSPGNLPGEQTCCSQPYARDHLISIDDIEELGTPDGVERPFDGTMVFRFVSNEDESGYTVRRLFVQHIPDK